MYKKSKNIILYHSGWWWNVMNGQSQRFLVKMQSGIVVSYENVVDCVF